MTKVSYTADGKIKIFYFDFPFYQKGDIVVAVNNNTNAPGFAVQIGNPNPIDVFPYTGGAVHFAVAPIRGTKIEIWREFMIVRPCDYQPMVKICPDDLNRDFNFNLENMKDFRRIVTEFAEKYTDVLQLANSKDLPGKIDAVIAEMEAFGDISAINAILNDIRADLDGLTQQVQELINNQPSDNSAVIAEIQTTLAALAVQVGNIQAGGLPNGADYIEHNNTYTNHTDEYGNVCATYSEDVWHSGKKDILATGITKTGVSNGWYKKDKNGMISQGGKSSTSATADGAKINMLITMKSTNYNLLTGVKTAWPSPADNYSVSESYASRTKNSFYMRGVYTNAAVSAFHGIAFDWTSSGI